MRLMIVEDNRTNLLVLKGILQKLADCEVEGYLDPLEAIERADAGHYDLFLVDYLMPGLDGRGFIARLRTHDAYRHVPIVMITADGNRQTRIDAITAGATDFLNKPVDPVELKARVGNLLALRQAQIDLGDRAEWLGREVERATRHINEREEEVIWRLSRALEFRDTDTGDHTMRVATVSRLIAEQLGLPRERCRLVYLATPLHDIGKVAIPDAVLSKPDRLNAEEITVMRGHVPIGVQILADGTSELIRMAGRIAASHHERWDGTGYPDGAKGEAIPIEGRIAAVADVFDALCSRRPYKPAWPLQAARHEILKGAGSQFDPACVAAFEACWPKIEELYQSHPDQAAPDLPLSLSA